MAKGVLELIRRPGEGRDLAPWLRLGRGWIAAFAGMTVLFLLFLAPPLVASEAEKPVARDYSLVRAPAAPQSQDPEAAEAKSAGCVSCHTDSDEKTMHPGQAVVLGCTDCHGGNAAVRGDASLAQADPRYVAARDKAHVLPLYPKAWGWPSSANPKRSYTLLNRESPEFVRFVNPSDYRVARESCGACHIETVEAAERSLMATGAMFWGAAAYNNGIVPFKTPLFGEAYTRSGEPARIVSPFTTADGTLTAGQKAKGALAELYPLPTWQVVPPGDIVRVFERGGRTIGTQFPEIGLPSPSGSIQRLEEAGRPDIRQSNRGPGTGLRVSIPILNIHKTRLNDPFMWFMGTNDQPGDYRHSGCSGCHVVYANDREPRHSLTYAPFGRDGQTATVDPTIAGRTESGHPIRHAFTRAIPTSQCMGCHMHQPNIFLNSFLGYTMWDYEADADLMWPGPENRLKPPPGKEVAYRSQHYPTPAEQLEVLERNPEGAAPRGLWGDVDFLRRVADDVNPQARHTQFADYHGHGWNFRAVYKRDRDGNLLDADGKIVPPNDPEKFRRAGEAPFAESGGQAGKAVHLMDIHAEKGMQCADCHFAQDSHGNGFVMGEVPDAIEIACKDCHGTTRDYPNLLTSGPAAPPKGTNLALLRNEDGQRRFEWMEDDQHRPVLVQRSVVDPKLYWRVSLVKESVDPESPQFNLKAARAKLMSKQGAETGRYVFGKGVAEADLAHKPEAMACYTCHLSWTTSCGGCHLPIEANWKTAMHRYEGRETRNFATYNPQVARDDMFQLGRHMTTKGNIIAPVRSSSALVLSSTNINRERIYVQQPPISASGFSSQAFAPHFPHTVRTRETKTCSDCHLSEKDDNNAAMAQLLLQGTNFVNFVGMNAWTGLDGGVQATRVTEWDEPQAVIGSYLQRFAYPDYYRLHVERNKRRLIDWTRTGKGSREAFSNVVQNAGGPVSCLQNRGEYLYAAEGKGGFRVYDIASIGNKGVSERIVTAPFSPLGQQGRVATRNATCMALPTNQPIAPLRNTPALREANREQAFAPIYHYAVITDAEEGLILVDIDTFSDGDPTNNFLKRALTWNPGGALAGARHVTLGGNFAYIAAASGLVVVDLSDPLHPRLAATLPLRDARASALQFRYLWVTDAAGLELFDVTRLDSPRPVPAATVPLADARKLYVARTFAYVAARAEGLVIVNVANPERPVVYRKETFEGRMNDVRDVVVASTNASLFAYVADGANGMKVLQLTSPETQPNFYGFSPAPIPELIAWATTPHPALAMAKGLDRDRAVDETGGQIAVFGRIGSGPLTREQMNRLYLNSRGHPFKVSDSGSMAQWLR
jgi:LVIVD repeat